ncbi:hypothetical protein [Thermospira aquatica]|uniref:Uncharacterized protein n=1 Tax=Thermospira aquatica TaxID=2828656 RepID=A0AAX3BBE4_9SPIR|nr:hypothetical protein [Thermospira aquatica]URA09354.1 hypothetical protein KDW03_07615 [Thermospira aquatica]
MKKLIVLIFAVVFLAIAGCQTEKKISEEDLTRNANLLKDEVLSQTNVSPVLTNEVTLQTVEPIVLASSQIESTNTLSEIAPLEDKPIEVPQTSKPAVSSSVQRSPQVAKVGSYMKVGTDRSGQTLSPRRYIKISSWVFTQEGKTVDFYLYAVPFKSGKVQSANLIGRVRGIEVINNQAQYTRYWNGITIHGNFLPKGKYNIYLTYVIKNSKGKVIKTESRYWGRTTDFYLVLE